MTAREQSALSEVLNALAKQVRAVADAAHGAGEKTVALAGHDYARFIEAKAEEYRTKAKLQPDFRVLP